jgi:hypothetical protein
MVSMVVTVVTVVMDIKDMGTNVMDMDMDMDIMADNVFFTSVEK